MTSANEHSTKYIRAQKRIAELKGLYSHLAIYFIVNGLITIYKVIKHINGIEEFFDLGIFAVWIFWGLGLLYHASKVYSYNPFFSKSWEERQIRKYMKEE